MADEGWKKPIFIVKWMTKYFDSLMEKLDAIQNMFGTSGDADVSSADIRLGKKAYNGTTLVTGTMPENVAVAETLTAGEAYVIPQGYHDGTGKVTADSLASQTDGTATAAQILSGKTAYVDGVKVTGSMTNNGAKTASLAAGASYTIPVGYHDGTGKVTANSLASQTDGTATAAQILSGKTAYVDGKKVTGSMGNKAGTTVEASAVTQDDTNTYFNIPAAGYYDTNSKVYTPNSNLTSNNITVIAQPQDNDSTAVGRQPTVTIDLERNGIYLIASGTAYNQTQDITITSNSGSFDVLVHENRIPDARTSGGGSNGVYFYIIQAGADGANITIQGTSYTIFSVYKISC